MTGLILTLHFIVCIFMIIVILLQAGKGADMGATFGGGSQTVFGPRGAATFLSKVTTVAAIIFLVTSVYLANVSKHQVTSSVVKGAKLPPAPRPESVPALTQPASPETDPQSSETKPK